MQGRRVTGMFNPESIGVSWADYADLSMAEHRTVALRALCDDALDLLRWVGLHDSSWPAYHDELASRGMV